MKLIRLTFFAFVIFTICPLSIKAAMAENMNTKHGQAEAISVDASGNSEKDNRYIRLERILKLNGQEMYIESSKLLNKYGWKGWGHSHYDFGKYTNAQMIEKRALFDSWAKGDDFKWINPIWSFSGHDPKIKAVLHGCDILEHAIIASNTQFESKPSSVSLPIEIGIGPVAVYPVNKDEVSQGNKKTQYAIVLKFNEVPREYFIGEKIIDKSKGFFSSTAFLYDLKKCEYRTLANLGFSYFGGYNENSIPRLTGVGYQKDKMVLYNIQDISPAYVLENGTTELHADLYSFGLEEGRGAEHILRLFYRESE